MQLRKIKGTSIVEITIALVIVSICLAIASQFFVTIDQQLKSPTQLKDELTYQNWMIENYAIDTIQNQRKLDFEISTINQTVTKMNSFEKFEFSLEVNASNRLHYEIFKSSYHE
jgi:type II secretory pathway pseudopilin PulG